jgi:hypothetical protein
MWEAQDSQEDAGSSVLTESSSSILTEDIPVAEYRCDVMRLLSWFVDGQDGKVGEIYIELTVNKSALICMVA